MTRAFVFTLTSINLVVVGTALVLPWNRDTMLVLGLCLVFQWLLYEILLREVNGG